MYFQSPEVRVVWCFDTNANIIPESVQSKMIDDLNFNYDGLWMPTFVLDRF